jgi:hypothetical protein
MKKNMDAFLAEAKKLKVETPILLKLSQNASITS